MNLRQIGIFLYVNNISITSIQLHEFTILKYNYSNSTVDTIECIR